MRPRGFTLIELLVVVAILALLIGLSVPSLRASRERARVAVCASNVKQLLLNLTMYETENQTAPYGFVQSSNEPSGYAGFAATIDLAGRWWFDYSEKVDYATGDGLDVLVCPSKRLADSRLTADILCGNYGANLSICRVDRYVKPYANSFSGTPLSLTQIRRPAETLLLVDSGYALISWWHVTEGPPVELPADVLPVGGIQHTAYVPGMTLNRSKTLWPGQTGDAIGGRHPRRTVNVGFVDGHGATKEADSFLVERVNYEQWNNSPLWQPHRETVTASVAVP